jgi:hypothetical protein
MGALKLIESLFMFCLAGVFILMMYLLYHFKRRITNLEEHTDLLDQQSQVIEKQYSKLDKETYVVTKSLTETARQVEIIKAYITNKPPPQAQTQSSLYGSGANGEPINNVVIMRSYPTTIDRTENESIDLSDLDEEEAEEGHLLQVDDEEVSIIIDNDISAPFAPPVVEDIESIPLDDVDIEPEPAIETVEEPVVTNPAYNKMPVQDLKKLVAAKSIKPSSECAKLKKPDLVKLLEEHAAKIRAL